MTDDTNTTRTGAGEPAEQAAPEAASAWRDVVSELDALGDAIGRWLHAAVNDPDNRRRAEELKERMGGIADTVASAVDSASESDVGASFKEAADKTGEAFKQAGERFSEEVAPRMASAFKGAASKLREAAERMERKETPAADESAAAGADESAPDAPGS